MSIPNRLLFMSMFITHPIAPKGIMVPAAMAAALPSSVFRCSSILFFSFKSTMSINTDTVSLVRASSSSFVNVLSFLGIFDFVLLSHCLILPLRDGVRGTLSIRSPGKTLTQLGHIMRPDTILPKRQYACSLSWQHLSVTEEVPRGSVPKHSLHASAMAESTGTSPPKG